MKKYFTITTYSMSNLKNENGISQSDKNIFKELDTHYAEIQPTQEYITKRGVGCSTSLKRGISNCLIDENSIMNIHNMFFYKQVCACPLARLRYA